MPRFDASTESPPAERPSILTSPPSRPDVIGLIADEVAARVIEWLDARDSEGRCDATETPTPTARVLTVVEFAQAAGRTDQSIRRWIADGSIEAHKVHGSWFIPATELAKVGIRWEGQ